MASVSARPSPPQRREQPRHVVAVAEHQDPGLAVDRPGRRVPEVAVAGDDAKGLGPPREHALRRRDEHLRRVALAEPADRPDDRAVRRQPELPPRLVPGRPALEAGEVDPAVHDHDLAGRGDAAPFRLDGVGAGDRDQPVGDPRRQPFGPEQRRPDAGRERLVVEREAVDRVDDQRHADDARGEAAEQPGLRAVGVDDVVLLAVEEGG
jgi:hypothetical protein